MLDGYRIKLQQQLDQVRGIAMNDEVITILLSI